MTLIGTPDEQDAVSTLRALADTCDAQAHRHREQGIDLASQATAHTSQAEQLTRQAAGYRAAATRLCGLGMPPGGT